MRKMLDRQVSLPKIKTALLVVRINESIFPHGQCIISIDQKRCQVFFLDGYLCQLAKLGETLLGDFNVRCLDFASPVWLLTGLSRRYNRLKKADGARGPQKLGQNEPASTADWIESQV